MGAEVIQAWGDAVSSEDWTFVRSKLEKHVAAICMGETPAVLPAEIAKKLQGGAAAVSGFTGKLKKDDVEFLMKELLLSKQQAEKVLAENDGDMNKALKALLSCSPSS
ncbi:hypothetical protein K437DRAFT_267215 [Tilletiaria anomala UBC 951]|uniref:Nascent polypeptide-associated complex subunit alpha-like UBA domain-containing protein n=1 Tax=Tilletiaria anomala (strain ATCC 24038 / CBS 436.72 / UBC 951) TaxID=1037660 RepID=A0A066WIK7_TILAU|nr:uncharacterized protein K437DRAFT_267215 [Tilletiaria anomala UBC 951]KDN50834.1 hypothetical protein K437DRAFT_267215 [Tilletiaria anomala UBC 951]